MSLDHHAYIAAKYLTASSCDMAPVAALDINDTPPSSEPLRAFISAEIDIHFESAEHSERIEFVRSTLREFFCLWLEKGASKKRRDMPIASQSIEIGFMDTPSDPSKQALIATAIALETSAIAHNQQAIAVIKYMLDRMSEKDPSLFCDCEFAAELFKQVVVQDGKDRPSTVSMKVCSEQSHRKVKGSPRLLLH